MIKLYAALGAVVFIALALWRYDYVMSENERLSGDLDAANATIKTIREDAEEIAALRDAYYIDLAEANAKNEKHEKCVADGTCVVTVGVLLPPTNCPGTPAVHNRPSAETTTARLSPASQEADSHLAKQIELNRAWERSCQASLFACADRCPKKKP